jgi:hypothetical protein
MAWLIGVLVANLDDPQRLVPERDLIADAPVRVCR